MSDIKRILQIPGNLAKIKYNKFKYGESYASPDKIIKVNPNSINYKLVPYFSRWVLSRNKTFVVDGEWDKRYADPDLVFPVDYNSIPKSKRLIKIENLDRFISYRNHFENNVPWENTLFYERRINEGFNTGRYNSEDGLQKRLNKIDDLYESINSDGYKSQEELKNNSKYPMNPTGWMHEIKVNITRDGSIVLDDGRNRFILAVLAGVNSIPVRVVARHRKWQKIRKSLLNNKDSSIKKKYLNHPDMKDIIDTPH